MSRLQDTLESWRGTPYVHGMCARGVGVDCWRWVCAVLDEVSGIPRAPLLALPRDAVQHRPALAARAIALLRRAYAPCLPTPVTDRRPGTLILEHPGHALIVDDDGLPWDAAPHGVRRGAWEKGLVLDRAFRIEGVAR